MAQRARGAEIIGGARASDRREAWAPTPRPAVSDHHRGGNVSGRTGACLSRASSSTEQMERPTAPGAEEIARVNDARSLLHATYPPAAMNVPLKPLRNLHPPCRNRSRNRTFAHCSLESPFRSSLPSRVVTLW
jgi:hypothetical protein